MAEKRLLIADVDAGAWNVFREALGEGWIVIGADSCAAAISETEKQAFDAVVANATLPEWGGAELLNRLREANPKIPRFIASDPALKEKLMSNLLGGDQFLPVPFDRATLKNSIERTFSADYGMNGPVRELVGRIRTFPTMPSLYVEVVNALQSPSATTADIGAIIARDLSMTTKLVQVINSAYLGLRRSITDPTEAVGLLGFETVKSLIMTVKLLSQYDKVKPVYFSIDNIWRHSTNVARTAKSMALLETNDAECAGTAYTGGLMHDLGKVILAANFEDQYHRAHTLARKQNLPLWQMEKEIFGATHGEIGAYLLSLWGMADDVVKVTAFHHEPLRAGEKTFTALTAVHVANVLEHERITDPAGLVAPMVDCEYLQALGMEDRVELWRFARRDTDATRFETKTQRNPAPTPVKKPMAPLLKTIPEPIQPITVEPPPPPHLPSTWKWLGIALGVCAAMTCLIWLCATKTPEIAEAPPADITVAIPAITPSLTLAEIKPVPVEAKSIVIQPAAALPAPPAQTGIDKLNLEAIFFSPQHPAALINGHLTGVDQEIADCRILDISRTSVTLEYQHQRKTLTLP